MHSMFPVNIALGSLSEDQVGSEAFVTSLRASVCSCDCVAPINWDRACGDLEEGFPMDCTGVRYIEQEEEVPTQDKEQGDPPQSIHYG